MSLPSVLRPTWVRYQVLAVACSLAVLTYLQRQGFVSSTPYIKEDLDLDDEQFGFLASAWLVAYGLFQMPGGLLGDRLGARHLLALLVLAWSLLVGLAALAPLFPPGSGSLFAFLLVVRFLFGGLQAGGFPALARVVADWVPARNRGLAQGMIWTSSRLGGFLAPLLALWLIRGTGGWQGPLWLLAGLGWAWCAGFWLWFRDRPEGHPAVNAAELALLPRPEPARRDPVPWRRFLSSPSVWGLCLMYGFVGFSGNFITSLLPIYLRDHRKLD
ncbi:MAG: MFS transporter, partial [Gemmataceae bacterium]|nr:MFS transporter [Gemmataceae bacterium]